MDPAARRIGNYRILGRLNAGGQGLVYRVEQSDGGWAALKLPRSSQPRDVVAFNREIRVLELLDAARVTGVVKLLETGRDRGRPWYAMEWVVGRDLRSVAYDLWSDTLELGIRKGATVEPLVETVDLALSAQQRSRAPASERGASPAREAVSDGGARAFSEVRFRRAVRILIRIACVLRDVHALGLIHGDLSPANVLVRESGEPVLLDFGTSLPVFDAGVSRETPYAWGEARGTPGYAAPELLSGDFLDWRCDVYALGCIAFELMLGRRPFQAAGADDLVKQHLFAAVPAPRELAPELPRQAHELLLRMLEKDVARRTTQIHAIISQLSQLLGECAPPARSQPAVVFFRPPLHGREPTMRALGAALVELEAEQGGLTLLRGSAGSGKTRLLNEVASLAIRRGIAVVASRGAEATSEIPGSGPARGAIDLLAPVLQFANEMPLSELASAEAAPVGFTLGQIKAILETYAPADWLEGCPSEPLPRLRAEAAAQRVYAAWVALLRRIAGKQGLLLILDDLHAADAFSRSFLSASAPQLCASRVLVLGSLRSDAGEALIQPLLAAARVTLEVSRLDSAAMLEVAKALLGTDDLPEGLDEYVLRHAEGNPLFAAEYLRLALDREWITLGSSLEWRRPRSTSLEQADGLIPRSIDDLVSARLSKLSPRAREVLQLGAILGREFDEASLQGVAAPSDAPELIRQLLNAHVLEELGAGRYRFAYDKLREVTLRSLPADERRALHRCVAESLERQPSPSVRSAWLGYHWAEAGDPGRAVQHLAAAAEEAVDENAHDTACDLYRAAVTQSALCVETAASTSRQRLLEQLGDVLLIRARHAEARECYERARQADAAGLCRARLCRKLACSFWTLHDYAAASAALAQAEQELSARTNDASPGYRQELIEVKLGRFEQLYFSQKQGPEIEALLQELGPLIERWGDPSQRNTFYLAAASQRQMASGYAFDMQAILLAKRAFDASHELTCDRRAVARFLYAFALVFGTDEHRQQALPHLERAAVEAVETQSTTLLSRVRTYHAIAALRLGRVAETRKLAESALRAAENARLPPYVAAAFACLGWAEWRSGDPQEARRQLQRARQIWLSHPHPFPFRWLAGIPLLAFSQADGDFAACLELLRDLTQPGQQQLPARLLECVQAVLAAHAAHAEHELSGAISRVLSAAREEHYC